VLHRRARVLVADAVQVRAQTSGPVAVDTQVPAAVVLAWRRTSAPPPSDDGRVRRQRMRFWSVVLGRQPDARRRWLGERHLLGRVRAEPTATAVRFVVGRRKFRARRQPGQDTHTYAAADSPAQEQDVH